jgi:hypothetical protein
MSHVPIFLTIHGLGAPLGRFWRQGHFFMGSDSTRSSIFGDFEAGRRLAYISVSRAPSTGHGPDSTRSSIFDGFGAGRLPQMSGSGAPSTGHGPDFTRSLIFVDLGAGLLPVQIATFGAPSAGHHPA